MPANPAYKLANFWQKILEPLGIAGAGLVLAGLGLNFLIARRSIKIEEEEG